MEQIKVILNTEDYSIKIEAEGYEGRQCLTDIEEFQTLLNALTMKEKIKDEYFNVKRTRKVSSKNRF